ncbi:MAG: ABC transporter permease [Thermodesulfobacteriota bacterium]
MTVLLTYGLRNIRARKITTGLTAGGMALVTFVFVAVLMLAEGLEYTLTETGRPENAIVLRGSAETEVSSVISRGEASIIETQPQIERDPSGEPVVAKETLVLVALPKMESGALAHVTVRGVGPQSFALRPQVKLVAGRMFRPGSREIIVGSSIARRIENCCVGSQPQFALSRWTVVGIFDAANTAFDSEIWGDVDQLMSAFRRNSYSAILARVPGRDQFQEFSKQLQGDPRFTIQVKRELEFYRSQSEIMAKFIRILGMGMTIFFSLGAILGAMVTMYAAVANRTPEIGTLRALGFTRADILSAFLAESLLIGLIGGVVGLLCGSLLQLLTISTLNWQTFSELAFGFKLTTQISAYGLAFAAAMGFFGGLLPAWRAGRLKIVDALRAS